MGWVARQGGAHHVPPYKNKPQNTKVISTVMTFANDWCKKMHVKMI